MQACRHSLRHALPLFTSLLNVVCAYDPVGFGLPYNHLLFSDQREQLVEQAVQVLMVALEHDLVVAAAAQQALDPTAASSELEEQEVRIEPRRNQDHSCSMLIMHSLL